MLPAVGFDLRSIQDEPDVRRERKRSGRYPAGLAAVLRQPGPDPLRGDTCRRQYRVAVPGVLVADAEQDVLCVDALAAEGVGLFPGPGQTPGERSRRILPASRPPRSRLAGPGTTEALAGLMLGERDDPLPDRVLVLGVVGPCPDTGRP
jgi:hypothetical protein